MKRLITILAVVVVLTAPAWGTITYNTSITGNILYGSGNTNGGFSVDQVSGVELGLRAHTRFPAPLNDNTNDGAGTYFFPAGGFGPGGLDSSWNFDWSINSNFDGSSGFALSQLTYLLELDDDPTTGTNFAFSFDPIHFTPCADNAIGNNSTASGAGATFACPGAQAGYDAAILANNLAQNSWRYAFFPVSFDPNVSGVYTIRLSAFNGMNLIAQTSINVVATPEPAAFGLLSAGLLGLGFLRRKQKARLARQ